MAEPRFKVELPIIESLNDPPHCSNAVVTEGGKMVAYGTAVKLR